MLGLQCPKLLWFATQGMIPEPDDAAQALFNQGHAVGKLAQELYPHGNEVEFGDFSKTLSDTKDLLFLKKPIYEASFVFDDCYCRVDVLVPHDDGWDIVEVKSSSRVKNEYYEDVAFQKWLLENADVKIKDCYVAHINTSYVRSGEINPQELFTVVPIDVDTSVIANRVRDFKRVMSGACPDVEIGPHCNSPYECPMKSVCWSLPEDNATTLYRSSGFEFIDDGFVRVIDVPAGRLNPKQRIQQEVVMSDERHVDSEKLKKWLDGLSYPVWMLDFECASSAIPFFDGTRPFQQVPFQFSLHKVEENGSVEHFEFLWKSFSDPRPALIEAMKVIYSEGTILAYYQSFEKKVIRELAQAYPEEKEFLEGLLSRFDDLLIPFSNFWLYDKKQEGSCSIKKVLPAWTGTGYDGMAIQDGNTAARAWITAVKDDNEQLLQDLLEYCKQDTQAMVDLFDIIKGL